jgi:hypothetical protein
MPVLTESGHVLRAERVAASKGRLCAGLPFVVMVGNGDFSPGTVASNFGRNMGKDRQERA